MQNKVQVNNPRLVAAMFSENPNNDLMLERLAMAKGKDITQIEDAENGIKEGVIIDGDVVVTIRRKLEK